VIGCDSVVHEVYTLSLFEELGDLKFTGGGGTDFRPVFKYIEEHKCNPTLLIFLTDMYGSFPDKEPTYPVVWVSTTEKKAPFGLTLHLNEDK
jgi:predicted metal-dependent peptidase